MEIILKILSVLGIALLGIIGLLLLIIIIILAVPIKYRAVASADGSKIKADVLVKWLLFIKVPLCYGENGLDYSVRIFGKQVFPKPSPDSKSDHGKASRTESSVSINNDKFKKDGVGQAADNSKPNITTSEPTHEKETEAVQTNDSVDKKPVDEKAFKAAEGQDAEENVSQKESIWVKLDKLVEKFIAVFKICEKEKSEVELFFKRKSTKFSLEILKRDVLRLLNHIRPRKLAGNVEFGFDDPATTGYTLAILSAFYGLYCENLEIIPDFTGKVIKGDVKFSGRIFLGYIVYIALDVYLRKQVRLFIKNVLALKDVSLENFDSIKAQFVSGDTTEL